VISQDLDELEEIADRIAVIFHGRLSEAVDAAAATREALGLLMGGSAAKGEAGGEAAGGAQAGRKDLGHAVGA
jgi:simple sugar transport system ATP-binding protein